MRSAIGHNAITALVHADQSCGCTAEAEVADPPTSSLLLSATLRTPRRLGLPARRPGVKLNLLTMATHLLSSPPEHLLRPDRLERPWATRRDTLTVLHSLSESFACNRNFFLR